MTGPLSPTPLTLEFKETELEALAAAAKRADVGIVEYIRDAALRMAAHDSALFDAMPGDPGAASSRRSLRSRRCRAAPPPHEIVRQLTTHLGAQLLSLTLAVDVGALEQWTKAENPPPSLVERRLRAAHDAWGLVASAESPRTVRAWWMGMQDELDDLSPAEAIALDRYDDVTAAARQFVEAG